MYNSSLVAEVGVLDWTS